MWQCTDTRNCFGRYQVIGRNIFVFKSKAFAQRLILYFRLPAGCGQPVQAGDAFMNGVLAKTLDPTL